MRLKVGQFNSRGIAALLELCKQEGLMPVESRMTCGLGLSQGTDSIFPVRTVTVTVSCSLARLPSPLAETHTQLIAVPPAHEGFLDHQTHQRMPPFKSDSLQVKSSVCICVPFIEESGQSLCFILSVHLRKHLQI